MVFQTKRKPANSVLNVTLLLPSLVGKSQILILVKRPMNISVPQALIKYAEGTLAATINPPTAGPIADDR